MELLTIHHIGEAAPRHIIAACDDTDTCPGCGAGYKVGMSACEYCRKPVRRAPRQQYRAVVFDEVGNATLRPRKLVAEDMLAIVHPGETIIPKAWA